MNSFPRREIVVLPPTPENVEKCRLIPLIAKYKIDSDSRARRTNAYKPIYRLKDGRYYINRYLGHWRQFVVGVKVMLCDGKPDLWFGLVLGDTEPKRSKE